MVVAAVSLPSTLKQRLEVLCLRSAAHCNATNAKSDDDAAQALKQEGETEGGWGLGEREGRGGEDKGRREDKKQYKVCLKRLFGVFEVGAR